MRLLTPDTGIYAAAALQLIRSAQTSLELQDQYIDLRRRITTATEPFADVLQAVIERQQAGVAVRVILSQYETADYLEMDYLEMLQTAGLDVVHTVRLLNDVHNRGMVVDDQRVLVSSQNWSTAGVLQDCDAGVIVDDATTAVYYRRACASTSRVKGRAPGAGPGQIWMTRPARAWRISIGTCRPLRSSPSRYSRSGS